MPQDLHFRHVGVPFGQFHETALHLEVHGVLGGCSGGQKVTFKMTGGVEQLNDGRCDNLGKKERLDLRNKLAIDGGRKGKNQRDHHGGIDPGEKSKEAGKTKPIATNVSIILLSLLLLLIWIEAQLSQNKTYQRKKAIFM
jgi:hypothetical protein